MAGHLHLSGYQMAPSAAPISPDNMSSRHHNQHTTGMMAAGRSYLPEHLPPHNDYNMMSNGKRQRFDGGSGGDGDLSMCAPHMHLPQSELFLLTIYLYCYLENMSK